MAIANVKWRSIRDTSEGAIFKEMAERIPKDTPATLGPDGLQAYFSVARTNIIKLVCEIIHIIRDINITWYFNNNYWQHKY
jgi:hypothetical protein